MSRRVTQRHYVIITLALIALASPSLAAKGPRFFCEKDGKPVKAKDKDACKKLKGVWKLAGDAGTLQLDSAAPLDTTPAKKPGKAPPDKGSAGALQL